MPRWWGRCGRDGGLVGRVVAPRFVHDGGGHLLAPGGEAGEQRRVAEDVHHARNPLRQLRDTRQGIGGEEIRFRRTRTGAEVRIEMVSESRSDVPASKSSPGP